MRACACERATTTSCLSNVKQLSTAVQLYLADFNGRLPNRDSWMNVLEPYVKTSDIFVDPVIKTKGQHGYAFDSRLSQKLAAEFDAPDRQSLLFESSNLGKNASDPFVSLPKPGRHYGKNNIGYLDGHARSRLGK
jgi:prepilin-type processing-associated H-X9-DG protein